MIGPAGFNQAPNTGVGEGLHDRAPIFDWSFVPAQPRCRWFVRRGGETPLDRGFTTKGEASAWIESFGYALDWRGGYTFRLKGDVVEMTIVDRNGREARS